MAVHRPDRVQRRAGHPHQRELDAQEVLADDVQRGVRQEVVDVADPAGEGVVDRDHREVGLAALHRREDVLERRARHRLPVGVVLPAHEVGVGAGLSLVGDASVGVTARHFPTLVLSTFAPVDGCGCPGPGSVASPMNESRAPRSSPCRGSPDAGRVTAHRGAPRPGPPRTPWPPCSLALAAGRGRCRVRRAPHPRRRAGGDPRPAPAPDHRRPAAASRDGPAGGSGTSPSPRSSGSTPAPGSGSAYAGEPVPTLVGVGRGGRRPGPDAGRGQGSRRYPGIGADLAGLLRADPQLAAALAGRRFVRAVLRPRVARPAPRAGARRRARPAV